MIHKWNVENHLNKHNILGTKTKWPYTNKKHAIFNTSQFLNILDIFYVDLNEP